MVSEFAFPDVWVCPGMCRLIGMQGCELDMSSPVMVHSALIKCTGQSIHWCRVQHSESTH